MRYIFAIIILLLLGFYLQGWWCNSLPDDVVAALEDANSITLYSLQPNKTADVASNFHRVRILGKIELQRDNALKIVKATEHAANPFVRAFSWKNIDVFSGLPTCGFGPKYGIRVGSGKHVYDFLLSYECPETAVYDGTQNIAFLEYTRGSPELLNQLLRVANIPLSNSPAIQSDADGQKTCKQFAASYQILSLFCS